MAPFFETGLNATFLPGLSGNWSAKASRRALGSREKPADCCAALLTGGTESVMAWGGGVVPGVRPEELGVATPERLVRFSIIIIFQLESLPYDCVATLPRGVATSGSRFKAIRIETSSKAFWIALME